MFILTGLEQIGKNELLQKINGRDKKGLGKTESGTWKYTIPRAERKLNPRCHCALSKKKSKIQCNEFSEDRRERIFKEFWKFTWHEKKVFVNMLVDTKNP
jgi:hypothetical protein